MDYILFTCTITAENIELVREILSQELANLGFESFEDDPQGLLAYLPGKNDSGSLMKLLPVDLLGLGKITYTRTVIKDQNWNELWESNFQPVLIADQCYIRAPFHERIDKIPYEIVIEPKMAFGTGHHETTSLMIEQMLTIDLKEKQILDMGCGTGVLTIIASKMKSGQIMAIDIDEWAYKSTVENCKVNHVNNVSVCQGDIQLISGKRFDVILANINRNILLQQIPAYAEALSPAGILLISGIYSEDSVSICQLVKEYDFVIAKIAEKNNWIAVQFIKN